MSGLAVSEQNDLAALTNLLIRGTVSHGWTAQTQIGVLLGFVVNEGTLAEACDYVRGVLEDENLLQYREGDTTETFPDEGAYQ
jgi:hypothetical protein